MLLIQSCIVRVVNTFVEDIAGFPEVVGMGYKVGIEMVEEIIMLSIGNGRYLWQLTGLIWSV